jgi:hypothetical protein
MAEWGEGLGGGAHHPTLAHTTLQGRCGSCGNAREIATQGKPRGATGPQIYMPRCSRRAHPRQWFLHKMLRMES